MARGSSPSSVGWALRYPGRLGAEFVLAFLVGIGAFAFAALVSTAARSHVPGEVLAAFLIVVVLAAARLGGVVYAVPVGVASIEAFDWFFLPPLRGLDWSTALVLGVFILTSILVAEIAARAGRHATASEEARGALAEEQAALRRVATLVARQAAPAELFGTVAEEVGRLLHVDLAEMLVYQSDGTAMVVGAWGVRGPPFPVGARVPLGGDNVTGRVFRTQRPARMDDYTAADGSAAETVRRFGVQAVVGGPIVVEGRLWGVMIAGALRPQPLPAGTESRIEAFTELVATAIANAEARSELERVAAEQAALGRVATLVAEAVPSAELFAAVAAEVAGLFEVPLVGLFRFGSDRTATAIAGSDALSPYVGRTLRLPPDDPGVLATVLSTGRPTRTDDVPAAGGAHARMAEQLDVGSAVGVPVIVEQHVWGCVTLGLAADRPLLPEDAVDRINAFTDLVATAIANAEAQTEIARLADEQAALRRVATLVARGAQPGEVFGAVVEEIRRVMDFDVTSVVCFERDATATVVATGGDGSSPVGSNWSLEGDNALAQVFRSGRAARVDSHEQASGDIAAPAHWFGGHSAVATPIMLDDRLWGAAVVGSTSAPLPADAAARIAAFGGLIATAISNAETRSALTASRARVVAAGDETRRRLERDLHDGLQQRLVSLALQARATATVTPRPSKEVQDELSLLADGLGAALDELREVSRGIHPAILSEAGLGPALKALARRSAVPVALHLSIGARLPEPLEAAAYYVASEALTNAVKHAQASVIELRAEYADRSLTLLIRDDGVGGAEAGGGSGIIGLRDRVEALGGTISIASPRGEGTTLDARLPAVDGAGRR